MSRASSARPASPLFNLRLEDSGPVSLNAGIADPQRRRAMSASRYCCRAASQDSSSTVNSRQIRTAPIRAVTDATISTSATHAVKFMGGGLHTSLASRSVSAHILRIRAAEQPSALCTSHRGPPATGFPLSTLAVDSLPGWRLQSYSAPVCSGCTSLERAKSPHYTFRNKRGSMCEVRS